MHTHFLWNARDLLDLTGVQSSMGRSAESSGSGRVLTLACKDCGREFASPVQVGPEVFTGMKVENCLVRCPLCHYARRY